VQYEQKVTGCSVWDEHPKGCKFALWGWWWGLPWCKSFTMRHSTDGGFHAALREDGWEVLPTWLRFRGGGGFALSGADGDVRVAHYERYGWPVSFPFVWLLEVPWNRWHLRGMEIEMEVIRTQVECIAVGLTGKSALVEQHFPEQLWTSWKYDATSWIKEMIMEPPMQHPGIGHIENGQIG